MIVITVTDPTPTEARLIADYFTSVADSVPFTASEVAAAALDAAQHETALVQIAPTIELPPGTIMHTDEEDEAFARLNTAAIFGGEIGSASMNAALATDEAKLIATGAMTDAAGMPWDGRIHASTKSTVAGGVWRLKKGVDDTLVASVTAELRAAMAAPAVVAPPPPPPAASFVAPIPGITAPPPPPPAGAMTFPQLMLKITSMPPGAETQARVTAAVQSVGLPSLPMLASRLDLVPAVAAALGVA